MDESKSGRKSDGRGLRGQSGGTGARCDGVAKICGADIELGNFIRGLRRRDGTGFEASRALLEQIHGISGTGRGASGLASGSSECNRFYGDGTWVSAGGYSGSAQYEGYADNVSTAYYSQDWGRKYLPANGGCVYVDLNHLEVCLPEVTSAFDHLACWHAMLRIARGALDRANAELPEGRRVVVLVNNSDGLSHSYGSHLNFLVTRQCFDNLFNRKLHHLLFLASYLTSSIIWSGAGKVGSENNHAPVDYQIAQRADFFETLVGPQTTYNRPIVNCRDESLCRGLDHDGDVDDAPHLARLHLIFFDNTLCHVSSLLKVGVTQIVLAMIEQEVVDPELILDDPVRAVIAWSHDPALERSMPLAKGGLRRTALELQMDFLERARSFVDSGRAEGLVPRAGEIMRLWEDTLLKLQQRDFEALAPRIDWVLKHLILEQIRSHGQYSWSSAAMKRCDLDYGNLDEEEGLYWISERAGEVERLVSSGDIERFTMQPPEDTRAWLRSRLLRLVHAGLPADLNRVDWDQVQFRFRTGGTRFWPSYTYRSLWMPDPRSWSRRDCEAQFEDGGTLEQLCARLGMVETDDRGRLLSTESGQVEKRGWAETARDNREYRTVFPEPDTHLLSGKHDFGASRFEDSGNRDNQGGEEP